jgi:hypothetical protein
MLSDYKLGPSSVIIALFAILISEITQRCGEWHMLNMTHCHELLIKPTNVVTVDLIEMNKFVALSLMR